MDMAGIEKAAGADEWTRGGSVCRTSGSRRSFRASMGLGHGSLIAMCDAKEVFKTWMAAYAKKDVEEIMGLYEKGCVYSEPCYPDKTYEDLEAWFEFDFSRSGPQPT